MNSKRIEEEYEEIVTKNSWVQIYQGISRQCNLYQYTCTEAKKPKNKTLNRYRDVNPYDHSRVILTRCNTDYINANLVKMERANRQYILTQGPLLVTVPHFWAMVWEQNTRAIIMLNKIIEKNESKCHWYWPAKSESPADSVMNLIDVKLKVENIEEEDCVYYTTRIFRLTDTKSGESRYINHFHYTTWPDFEVPSSPVAFLKFLEQVRASSALEPAVGPAVVHCSAGIGRSGTFCLVDTVLLLVEQEGQANVNIQDILLDMRKYRMGLIQTSEQLRFSYQAIIEGIKRLNPEYRTQMDESIYSAVAEDEEAPPLPPPRGESLGHAPARPLPAIPASSSLGNLNVMPVASQYSSSEEDAPALPPRERFPTPERLPESKTPGNLPTPEVSVSEGLPGSKPRETQSSDSSVTSGDENDEKELLLSSGEPTGAAEVRRRKNRQLSERVASIRKRARDAERLQSLKRSLYTPIAISVGFLLAGILIYSYVKH